MLKIWYFIFDVHGASGAKSLEHVILEMKNKNNQNGICSVGWCGEI